MIKRVATCASILVVIMLIAPSSVRGSARAPSSYVTSTLVTGADSGGSPHVRGFDGSTFTPIHDFLAYADTLTGGVRVAAADVNGDGVADIITGPGPGGGPHVKVFDGQTGTN